MINYSIMIIDDNEDDRYLLKRLIKKTAIEINVFEAVDGVEAIEFLSNYENNIKKYGNLFPPVLIFLDINMPLMNGFECLEQYEQLMREHQWDYTSIFIMFSSSEREEEKKKAQSFSFVKGFVVKGELSQDLLKQIVNEHINHVKN